MFFSTTVKFAAMPWACFGYEVCSIWFQSIGTGRFSICGLSIVTIKISCLKKSLFWNWSAKFHL